MPEEIQPVDEGKVATENPGRSLSGINKLLLILALLVAVAFIGQLTAQYFLKQTNKITQNQPQAQYPTLTSGPPPSAPPPANVDFYKTIRNNQNVPADKLVTSEYKGKLIEFSTENDQINLKIDNGAGLINELVYDNYVPIDDSGLKIKDIKVGDNIIVRETTDVTKEYPKGIVSIKITSYYELVK